MAYKSTVRRWRAKKPTTKEFETVLDECLREGTDQGWVLHKYESINLRLLFGIWLTFIWETND
jgi:hypothetical protein